MKSLTSVVVLLSFAGVVLADDAAELARLRAEVAMLRATVASQKATIAKLQAQLAQKAGAPLEVPAEVEAQEPAAKNPTAISLKDTPPMTPEKAAAVRGSRLMGQSEIVSIDPSSQGVKFRQVTVTDTSTQAYGLYQRKVGSTWLSITCRFDVPERTALSWEPGTSLNIAGDVESVEMFRRDDGRIREVRYHLVNVSAR